MSFKIPALLRPMASKAIAFVVVAGGAWIGSKLGTDPIISPDTAAKIAEGALGWLTLTAIHTGASAKINPTNAASPALSQTVPSSVIPKSELKEGNVTGSGIQPPASTYKGSI